MTDSSATKPGSQAVTALLRGGLELIALRALGNVEDARDAIQETLTRTWSAIQNGVVPVGVPIPAFAHGVMRHVLADALARRKRSERDSSNTDALEAPQPSPLEQLVTTEEEAAVRRALLKLGPDDRELLERCFLRGERVADIARSLGLPADRLRKRKSRALERLRALLENSASGHVFVDSST
jgi:RNA polymerase sigma-70 factor (ECF subfamily)